MYKICCKCRYNKEIGCFHKDKNRNDGLQTVCKQCSRLYSQERNAKRKEEYKRWYQDNKIKVRNYKLKRKFKISISEYNDMFDEQNGLCAICKKSEIKKHNGTIQSLAVDHNHSTGKVRALLCSNCNTALGSLKENKDIIFNMIDYIDKYNEVG
jgi:hypothetical protein